MQLLVLVGHRHRDRNTDRQTQDRHPKRGCHLRAYLPYFSVLQSPEAEENSTIESVMANQTCLL